jgi:hypothetical protein
MRASQIYKELQPVLASADIEAHVVDSVIPRMYQRRGRTCPPSPEEVRSKLTSMDSRKPGEEQELFAEARRDPGVLTPAFAAEAADVFYYSRQLPPAERAGYDLYFLIIFGDIQSVAALCALKYETRLRVGDSPQHKRTENAVLGYYLRKNFSQMM